MALPGRTVGGRGVNPDLAIFGTEKSCRKSQEYQRSRGRFGFVSGTAGSHSNRLSPPGFRVVTNTGGRQIAALVWAFRRES